MVGVRVGVGVDAGVGVGVFVGGWGSGLGPGLATLENLTAVEAAGWSSHCGSNFGSSAMRGRGAVTLIRKVKRKRGGDEEEGR